MGCVTPLVASVCEPAGPPLWTQPPSAWSSLAFVVAGLWILVVHRRRRPEPNFLGVLTILIGVGSAVQHGPAPSWNPVLHDPPLMGALALVASDAVADLTRRPLRHRWWLGLTALVVVLAAAAPGASEAVQVATAVVAVGASLVRAWQRPSVRRRTLAAVVLLAVGGAVGRYSAPGWPWCVPGGWLDGGWSGHAVWHVAAAVALAVLAPTVGRRAEGPR
jgi:hypothetical protein